MEQESFDVQGFARDVHELLVLTTLREQSKHGYQIALDVEADSNGLFQFKHGTLYPILHRLEGEGLVRVFYFAVLISHIVLAAVVPILAVITIYLALRGRFQRHRRIARWTLPIWLYVSLTGVVVYLMLYVL